ncbi:MULTISPECIES: class I SAM-dependent methyltransferase [Bacillus]|uniref:class I SAM-dependent methyltransferase n=1 Tax=Bacillus TaxID=1386 RepID=UPI0004259DBB|nr:MULTISPECIES: class I SAM-dependent methyltransferase [Bacillus]QHZ47024.1 class I SAM-dependent methyltransferase [Bacillus sp. NSP9.1]
MVNFDPEKLKKLLDSATNPANPKDTKIKNYYVNQEFVAFDIDSENVEIALRIAGHLGKTATTFTITNFLFPDTNKIDYIQFMVFKINDPELLAFLDEI